MSYKSVCNVLFCCRIAMVRRDHKKELSLQDCMGVLTACILMNTVGWRGMLWPDIWRCKRRHTIVNCARLSMWTQVHEWITPTAMATGPRHSSFWDWWQEPWDVPSGRWKWSEKGWMPVLRWRKNPTAENFSWKWSQWDLAVGSRWGQQQGPGQSWGGLVRIGLPRHPNGGYREDSSGSHAKGETALPSKHGSTPAAPNPFPDVSPPPGQSSLDAAAKFLLTPSSLTVSPSLTILRAKNSPADLVFQPELLDNLPFPLTPPDRTPILEEMMWTIFLYHPTVTNPPSKAGSTVPQGKQGKTPLPSRTPSSEKSSPITKPTPDKSSPS